ncbi:hypothetical protein N0V85_009727 [Neurospora sp. IMI 360204]|nr:hypothetical protein N0V85_009727 [Neurospora sp. IMI 360204]
MSSPAGPINTSKNDTMNVEATNHFLKELQNRILQLEEQLKAKAGSNNDNPKNDNPAEPPVARPTLPKKNVKIEAPDKFGGQQDRLQGFLLQIRTYLDYYPESFPTETDKVIFTGTRLKDRALTWYEPVLQDWYSHGDRAKESTKQLMTNLQNTLSKADGRVIRSDAALIFADAVAFKAGLEEHHIKQIKQIIRILV